jgi:hypothetical protein
VHVGPAPIQDSIVPPASRTGTTRARIQRSPERVRRRHSRAYGRSSATAEFRIRCSSRRSSGWNELDPVPTRGRFRAIRRPPATSGSDRRRVPLRR